jgi:DNA-binding FadR family transcriptional regulator
LFDRADRPKPAFDAVMSVAPRSRAVGAAHWRRPNERRIRAGPEELVHKLAQRIRGMIQKGDYGQGDRLPPIMEMAKRFSVGHPTIREALEELETMGIVEIRHGSGVYVSRSEEEVLVLASPDYPGTVTRSFSWISSTRACRSR